MPGSQAGLGVPSPLPLKVEALGALSKPRPGPVHQLQKRTWHQAGSGATALHPLSSLSSNTPSVQFQTYIILSSSGVCSVQAMGLTMVVSDSHTMFNHPTQEDLRRLSHF